MQQYEGHRAFEALSARATRQALQALVKGLKLWVGELSKLGDASDGVLHGEFCVANLLLRKESGLKPEEPPAAASSGKAEPSADDVRLLDFEQLGGGPAAWDLAFFLCSSCEADRASDAAVLKAYQRELKATLDAKARAAPKGAAPEATPYDDATLTRQARACGPPL